MVDASTEVIVGLGLLAIKVFMAAIPAMLAQEKGRSFWQWFFFGILSFTIATVWALLLKPTEEAVARNRQRVREASLHEQARACPSCHELMRPEIQTCGLCGAAMAAA